MRDFNAYRGLIPKVIEERYSGSLAHEVRFQGSDFWQD